MSKEMYPETQESQKERLNFYKRSEQIISVSRDYFEEIKKGLSTELAKGYVETNVCLAHHFKISQEFEELKKMIEIQNLRILQLEQDKVADQPKVVILEEVTKEEAKKLVEYYFKEHGCADIEELMLNLKISVQDIVEIIDELQKEGKLAPKGE